MVLRGLVSSALEGLIISMRMIPRSKSINHWPLKLKESSWFSPPNPLLLQTFLFLLKAPQFLYPPRFAATVSSSTTKSPSYHLPSQLPDLTNSTKLCHSYLPNISCLGPLLNPYIGTTSALDWATPPAFYFVSLPQVSPHSNPPSTQLPK